ncbi:uncharacterized protein BX663DRAFT_430825, partial [Cokeromyces recurvatus]|uniref:uncharacterized protein n=1 Tax=Cokeromyces recurvatus TaxID=90255 RepID=UPI0022204B6D
MQTQEIQGLRQGLFKLNEKYLKQIEHTVIAEQARTAVEQELEELSCKLFEEANKMVSKERRALFDAQKRIEQLERTLERVHEELNHEHAQLEELRKKFQEQ